MKFESLWEHLDRNDRTILFACLWAGMDAPLDLTAEQNDRLEQLADFVNENW